MDILGWLQELGRDASAAPGFQASILYVVVSVAMPIGVGLAVGYSLRLIERIFGVELGRGRVH